MISEWLRIRIRTKSRTSVRNVKKRERKQISYSRTKPTSVTR